MASDNPYSHYVAVRRRVVVDLLGAKCVRCGFTDRRALQIDHIGGGGVKEFRQPKFNYYRWLKVVVEDLLTNKNTDARKYQLLCANCNWIKRHENNENAKARTPKVEATDDQAETKAN